MRIFLILLIIVANGLFSIQSQAFSFKGQKIIMSAANTEAVRAGEKIAKLGGNPVDVAVAIVLAMSVTNATNSALGGGGFALVKMGKSLEAIDFRERAPAATSPDYYKNKKSDASVTGGTAVGVPGLPAGLYELHKKHGKIHWSRLFDEAIRLANSGYQVTGEFAEELALNAPRFNGTGKKYFLKDGATPFKPGDLLVQKQLGKALSEMRNRNIVSFYNGPIAKDIVDTVVATGGHMTLKDMRDYKVVWRKPLKTTYADHTIYLMPPPSSGGIVIKTALALIEKLEVNKLAERSIDEYHMLGMILNRPFRGRSTIADPDHHNVPLEKLLSDKYISELADSIKLKEATTIEPLKEDEFTTAKPESNETTHISVLDMYGNAVAMTITLNGNFGSGVASEKYGIMLNNEMDDFTTRPGIANLYGLIQGQGNNVSPGKRPLSSMSPTLVEKNGKVIMAVGAPGGPRIISSVLQTLYRTIGRKQELQAAVESPRVHHQFLPNKLMVDENRFSPETLAGLKDKKHDIEESWQALVYVVRNNNGILEGVVDTRAEGSAAGF